MRVAICISIRGKVYRAIWLNEDASGFYTGSCGAPDDVHLSYHRDGKKHFRDSRLPKPFGPHQEVAIEDFRGYMEVGHLSCPLTDAWFTSKTEYRSKAAKEQTIVIGGQGFVGYDTLAVNTFLVHAESTAAFFEELASRANHASEFEFVASISVPLEHFPDHYIIPTMWKANIRANAATN